jgi:hypothetical protein
MADQPLNAAKVEYPCTDLGGATTWLVPEAIGPNFETSAVTIAKLSWLSQFDDSLLGRGVSLLGGEMKASNTPTIRPPFPRAVTNFRA